MVCQLFSPYGETHALLLTCFPEKICFPDIRPRKEENLTTFQKGLENVKTASAKAAEAVDYPAGS